MGTARPTDTHFMLDLEFLGSHDGPFDFVKSQLKLKL